MEPLRRRARQWRWRLPSNPPPLGQATFGLPAGVLIDTLAHVISAASPPERQQACRMAAQQTLVERLWLTGGE